MNAKDLNTRLLAEGCKNFWIKPWRDSGVDSLVDVLENVSGVWRIYYTERGISYPPKFEFFNEVEACEQYYRLISSKKHWHGVGTFKDEQKALVVHEKLQCNGVDSVKYRTHVPSTSDGQHSYIIGVYGKDIFKVRELYGDLPLSD